LSREPQHHPTFNLHLKILTLRGIDGGFKQPLSSSDRD
jgi:hypothetical protein